MLLIRTTVYNISIFLKECYYCSCLTWQFIPRGMSGMWWFIVIYQPAAISALYGNGIVCWWYSTAKISHLNQAHSAAIMCGATSIPGLFNKGGHWLYRPRIDQTQQILIINAGEIDTSSNVCRGRLARRACWFLPAWTIIYRYENKIINKHLNTDTNLNTLFLYSKSIDLLKNNLLGKEA